MHGAQRRLVLAVETSACCDPGAPRQCCLEGDGEGKVLHIIWTIIIGFIAGIIAKWIHSGPNEPSGFILTSILGIVGAFVATYLGQLVGWYGPNEGAGFIASIVGAVIVLAIWSVIARRSTTSM
jgi:uncharacterized membrane protein YeaQ/YmgE (transglycosylase-associated protein family)